MKVDGDEKIVTSTFLCLDPNPPDHLKLKYQTNRHVVLKQKLFKNTDLPTYSPTTEKYFKTYILYNSLYDRYIYNFLIR